MNTSFDKEFKILKNVYYFILIGVGIYLFYTFYNATFVIFDTDFFQFNGIVGVIIAISIVILLINQYYYNKRIKALDSFKGLNSTKLKKQIDSTVLYLFIFEFPILINIALLSQTQNNIYFYIALLLLLVLVFKYPKKENYKF